MSEHDLQRAVAQYLDLVGVLWCHVPNGARLGGRKGAAVTASRLKAEGLKAGVPDVLIFERWREQSVFPALDPLREGHGVAIELKAGRGRLRPAQAVWLTSLAFRGWYISVCRSTTEVVDLCERLGISRAGR